MRVSTKPANRKHSSLENDDGENGWSFLDLFSTSQTFDEKTTEIPLTCASDFCSYSAPYFAYKKQEHTYGVLQGCCNHWDCPRCGIMRAKKEYGRIVEGCRTLSEKHTLYFITITCRGREMSRSEAIAGYLHWTNKVLTCWRAYAARHNQKWTYVQVTEHQTRGHPHSHILTTFCPPDLVQGFKGGWQVDSAGNRRYEQKEALRSEYTERSCIRSGLGNQYDISKVSTVEGASRYVAKYLFKPTIFSEKWPRGWRRVRYAQSFPKLPERDSQAFVLMTREDWRKLGNLAAIITSSDYVVGEVVKHHLPNNIVISK